MSKVRIIPVLWLTLCCSFGYAQPGGGPPGDPGAPVPLTGLEILFAGGVALGVRSLLKKGTKKN